MNPAEPIEGHPVVLVAFDAGDGVPGPLPAVVCGVCSSIVAVAHDGELRHLAFHEAAGTLG